MAPPAAGDLDMTQGEPKKHFSMIREFHLADLFTMANGFCGVAAILQIVRYAETKEPFFFWLAVALIPVALAFDFLDGRIARARHTHSPMGRELDSLADVISFGVAPAVIAYAAGLDGLAGHRSVGGLRASIYNAFPKEGVEALVGFMKEFQRKRG